MPTPSFPSSVRVLAPPCAVEPPSTYTLVVDGYGPGLNITTSDRSSVVRVARSFRAQRLGFILVNHPDADLVGYYDEDEIQEDGHAYGGVYES